MGEPPRPRAGDATSRSDRIAAVVFLTLSVACASPDISVDERADLSRYRTWSWLPGKARFVEAHNAAAVPALEGDLARLVERALALRGFERVEGEPDLRVGAMLVVRLEHETVYETGAVEHLSSLHHSPSFEVQATVPRTQVYERARLALFVADPKLDRLVWQGTLEDRFRDEFAPHLEGSVEALLQRFPRVPDRATPATADSAQAPTASSTP